MTYIPTLRDFPLTLTLTAATGSATTDKPVVGRLHAIFIDFTGVPATTVLTFTDQYGRTLLTTPAGNTDVTYHVRPVEHDVAGVAQTTRTLWAVHGYITVAASASGAGTVAVRLQVID